MAFSILVVDDSPAMQALIRRVLDLSGFDVAACWMAGNGEEALELLRQNWVDVILTDVNMPGMNGEEFLRRLRADEVLQSIPVVVVSTDATQTRLHRMLELGAASYVVKPFHPEVLRTELERVLGVPYV